ncbi:alpha-L-rhamnosidase C-terminal domain-containing protein [Spirosoma pulveris]
MKWLGKWQENVTIGLSTYAETSDVNTPRSDCHAWGTSSIIEFFRTILGIESAAPGFASVKIASHLSSRNTISGEIPHPNGKVAVSYTLQKGALRADVTLPPQTTGSFVWKGKIHVFKTGKNTLTL